MDIEQRKLFLSEIERVGMAKFSEIFYGIVEKQKYTVNPEEFFSGDPNFDEIYMKLLKEFHLSLFRAFLPHAKPEQFAGPLSCLGEHDLPKKQLLEELDSTPPPLEEMKPLNSTPSLEHLGNCAEKNVSYPRLFDDLEIRDRVSGAAIHRYMESCRK